MRVCAQSVTELHVRPSTSCRSSRPQAAAVRPALGIALLLGDCRARWAAAQATARILSKMILSRRWMCPLSFRTCVMRS